METQHLSVDRLSTLPQNLIESILCRVPIQEAARTSILSKEWRYHWTTIPKLVFDENTFEVSTDEDQMSVLEQSFENSPSERKNMTKRCKLFYAIYQVLLLHQGPVVDFTLSMWADDTCVEVDQIILYLSRKKTVKKLRLGNIYRLPLNVFSLHQLTDLYIHNCCIHNEPTISTLDSLTTLCIEDVAICKKTLVRLLSNCPSLKTFSLFEGHDHIFSDDRSGLIELFECLPLIENLTFYLWGIECFGEGVHPRQLPTSLIHLKYICLQGMCFVGNDGYGLPFLALLIRASPNIKKIKLQMVTIGLQPLHIRNLFQMDSDAGLDSIAGEDCSDIWLENLGELEIENFGNMKPDLDFVMLMLAKSPLLKKVKILLNEKVDKDKELEMLRLFLSCPHASPVVKFIVQHRF